MTGISIPNKDFKMSSLAQKSTQKLTEREKNEVISELREKEFLLVLVLRKVASTTE